MDILHLCTLLAVFVIKDSQALLCYHCFASHYGNDTSLEVLGTVNISLQSGLINSSSCGALQNNTDLSKLTHGACKRAHYCATAFIRQDDENWVVQRFCAVHCYPGRRIGTHFSTVECCSGDLCNAPSSSSTVTANAGLLLSVLVVLLSTTRLSDFIKLVEIQ
ncbi:uncharacterized protein LOC141906147 [Tubulanus polymorphus]|uniref:uncharacterized protein LOC141906147 n=1 Tax=Tubulanus polymorphus TaxID=672921 RepID=UPI003DA1D173